MQPRRHAYQFAHVALRDLVLSTAPGAVLARFGSDASLVEAWARAADPLPEGERIPPEGLSQRVVGDIGGWQALLIRPPSPKFPTEAHAIGIVWNASAVRYFVCEKGFDGDDGRPRAYLAEWSPGPMRIRLPDVEPEDGAILRAIAESLAEAPAPAGPSPARAPVGGAPAPSRKFLAWAVVAPLVILLLVVGVFVLGGSGGGPSPEAAARDAELAERGRLERARTAARDAVGFAEMAQKERCRSKLLTRDPLGLAERAFWANANVTPKDKAALRRAPVYGEPTLESYVELAAAVGGFACAVGGLDELKRAAEATDARADALESLAKQVRSSAEALAPPDVVIQSYGGCKIDKKRCRAALLWIDTVAKKPVATLWADAPWVGPGKGQNDAGIREAKARLVAELRGW